MYIHLGMYLDYSIIYIILIVQEVVYVIDIYVNHLDQRIHHDTRCCTAGSMARVRAGWAERDAGICGFEQSAVLTTKHNNFVQLPQSVHSTGFLCLPIP